MAILFLIVVTSAHVGVGVKSGFGSQEKLREGERERVRISDKQRDINQAPFAWLEE